MHPLSRFSSTQHTLHALGIALMWGCSGREASSTVSDGGVRDPADASLAFRIPGCPETLPAAGSPCSIPSPVCEYGDTPHCTTLVSCGRSSTTGPAQWIVSGPDPSCAGNPTGCPAAFAALPNGAACPVSATCTYAEGRCGCSGCVTNAGAAGFEWECSPWLHPEGCPERAPLIGTACAVPGHECAYGTVCCAAVDVGREIKCIDGYWQNAGVGGCACGRRLCGE